VSTKNDHLESPERKAELTLRRLQTEVHLNSARVLRAMERRIATLFADEGVEMTPAQGNALVVLFHHKTPMTAVQLASELGISQATVTRFVKSLESGGWIEREKDPADARAMLIRLTAKAYESLPTMIQVSNTMLDQAFDGIDPDRVALLARLTEQIRDNLT